MPTLLKTTTAFRKLFNGFQDSFSNTSINTLSNFLWQIIINRDHDNEVVVFYPILNGSQQNSNITIGIITNNKPGYINSNVEFKYETEFSHCEELCDRLNTKLFGIRKEISMLLIAQSFIRPKVMLHMDKGIVCGVYSNLQEIDTVLIDEDNNADDQVVVTYWDKPDRVAAKFSKLFENFANGPGFEMCTESASEFEIRTDIHWELLNLDI